LRIRIEADGNKLMHPRRKIIQDGSLLEFVKCTGWNFAANISSKITLDVSCRLAKKEKGANRHID
jgi:hypothetical protein